jgi:glutathione-regulated potassium-efflux system ancillary protein KefG
VNSRRLLVLFAHPSIERSEINSRLASLAREHPQCTLVDLYAEYPDYRIDVDMEQQRLRDHDVVVFLFPLYWYSTPAILKEWQDLVLEYGFAYGSEGTALAGKFFIAACSAGGPARVYDRAGHGQFALRELLRPLEQTAGLCRMRCLPPFALFASRTAVQEGRHSAHEAEFVTLLDRLAGSELDTWAAAEAGTANELLADAGTGARDSA